MSNSSSSSSFTLKKLQHYCRVSNMSFVSTEPDERRDDNNERMEVEEDEKENDAPCGQKDNAAYSTYPKGRPGKINNSFPRSSSSSASSSAAPLSFLGSVGEYYHHPSPMRYHTTFQVNPATTNAPCRILQAPLLSDDFYTQCLDMGYVFTAMILNNQLLFFDASMPSNVATFREKGGGDENCLSSSFSSPFLPPLTSVSIHDPGDQAISIGDATGLLRKVVPREGCSHLVPVTQTLLHHETADDQGGKQTSHSGSSSFVRLGCMDVPRQGSSGAAPFLNPDQICLVGDSNGHIHLVDYRLPTSHQCGAVISKSNNNMLRNTNNNGTNHTLNPSHIATPQSQQMMMMPSHWTSLSTSSSFMNTEGSSHQLISPHLDGDICSVKFSPSAQMFASGGNDNTACLWSLANLKEPVMTYTHHTGAIKGLAWNPMKSHELAMGGGSLDCSISVVSTNTSDETMHGLSSSTCCTSSSQGERNPSRFFVDTGSQITQLHWTGDGRYLVSCHGYSRAEDLVLGGNTAATNAPQRNMMSRQRALRRRMDGEGGRPSQLQEVDFEDDGHDLDYMGVAEEFSVPRCSVVLWDIGAMEHKSRTSSSMQSLLSSSSVCISTAHTSRPLYLAFKRFHSYGDQASSGLLSDNLTLPSSSSSSVSAGCSFATAAGGKDCTIRFWDCFNISRKPASAVGPTPPYQHAPLSGGDSGGATMLLSEVVR